jgi:Predicted membrane protein
MQILTLFIVALVAIEHVGIAGLEMFAKPEVQANAFDMPVNFVKTKEAQTALANQGIYNGMFGILIMSMVLFFTGSTLKIILILMMLYIIVVAVYGAFTATKKILYLQGLPALIAMIFVIIFYH